MSLLTAWHDAWQTIWPAAAATQLKDRQRAERIEDRAATLQAASDQQLHGKPTNCAAVCAVATTPRLSNRPWP